MMMIIERGVQRVARHFASAVDVAQEAVERDVQRLVLGRARRKHRGLASGCRIDARSGRPHAMAAAATSERRRTETSCSRASSRTARRARRAQAQHGRAHRRCRRRRPDRKQWREPAIRAVMRAVAERACRRWPCSRRTRLCRSSRRDRQRGEAGALVRAVAEGLVAAAPAGAPEIAFAGFDGDV